MNDFRLEVFLSVARNLSFTKASNELFISQPAISKHIGELESIYGIQLFERANNRIELTQDGRIFLKYAEDIHNKYRELQYEMSLLSNKNRGILKIGASTTISQYLLPAILSKFKSEYPDIQLSLISGNSEYIENLISNHVVDLGIVEGINQKREYKYTLLEEDELVLVKATKYVTKEEVTLQELTQLPLVVREDGSGTLEVIYKLLKDQGIKATDLNIIMRLGSSESIKRFIVDGNSYAIISIAAIIDELKRNELSIIDIKDVNIKRDFSFITNNGSQDKLVEKFIQFALLRAK